MSRGQHGGALRRRALKSNMADREQGKTRNVCKCSATSEAKTSIIARTPAKAVDTLYARICLRTINLLNSYYLKIIVSEPSLDIRTSS